MPPEAIVAFQIITLGFTSCIYISSAGRVSALLPAGGRARDLPAANSQTSWTDRCPMPVLALSVLYAVMASGHVFQPGYRLGGAGVRQGPFRRAGAVVALPLTLVIA